MLWIAGIFVEAGVKEGDKDDLMFGLCPLVCCVLPALIVPFALTRWA